MRRRRHRFRGAGISAEREFRRERRKNIRDQWLTWLGISVVTVGFVVWSFFVPALAARTLWLMAGIFIGVMLVVWNLGGHISAFRWWLGAEGERETAKELESLNSDWHCEHDLEHDHGNWDHVLIGPAGVFLLDSKLSHTTTAAGGDALRSGRISHPGRVFRGSAKRINHELRQRLGRGHAPWVQAVVVIWGDFPQARHTEEEVVYLEGEQLIPWLTELPQKLNAPQRAALITALADVRQELGSA